MDDYVQATVNKDGFVTKVDLTRVDHFALRPTLESGSLSSGTEHTSAGLNHPYKKFEVKILKENNGGKCPDGYRKPNQRELALIAGYSTKKIPQTASCTYSDLTYKTDKYYITDWSSSINIVTLAGSKNSPVTRCVKDID